MISDSFLRSMLRARQSFKHTQILYDLSQHCNPTPSLLLLLSLSVSAPIHEAGEPQRPTLSPSGPTRPSLPVTTQLLLDRSRFFLSTLLCPPFCLLHIERDLDDARCHPLPKGRLDVGAVELSGDHACHVFD